MEYNPFTLTWRKDIEMPVLLDRETSLHGRHSGWLRSLGPTIVQRGLYSVWTIIPVLNGS